MSVYSDFKKFVNDLEASGTFTKWCSSNASDCATWKTYRTSLLTATPSPTAPTTVTQFGKALVDVGVMAVDAGLVPPPPPPPAAVLTASFTYSEVGLAVSFISTSKPGLSGPITAWHWDFGDGNSSTAQNPSHTYAAGGSFTVTLTVTSPDGTATASAAVVVVNPAVLTAAFTYAVSTLTAVFSDHSTPGPSGPITAWHWDFGDGNSSTAQNPSHTYAAGGSYDATLTVTGTTPDGTATVTHTVAVAAAPPPVTTYRPYTSVSAFNQPLPSPAPIHPSSATMISAASHWLLGGTSYSAYEEWLGPRNRAVYFRGDTSGITRVPIYANWNPANGYVCASTPIFSAPIPSWFASILQGLAPTGVDGDLAVAIVDSITGDGWEFWKLTPPGMASKNISCSSGRWNAIAANYFKADTIIGNGYSETPGSIHNGFTSESYCHFYSGLLVPDDFADCFAGSDPGTAVEHAIYLEPHPVSSGAISHVSPARRGVGTEPDGPPYGARIQLDPTINVGTWASVNAKSEPYRSGLKKMLRGFQKYGGIVMDDTGGIGAGGISSCHPASVVQGTYNGKTGFRYPWDVAGYGWGYKNGIPYDLMPHFRVVDWTKWTGV